MSSRAASLSLATWLRLLLPPVVVSGLAVLAVLAYAHVGGVAIGGSLLRERPVLASGLLLVPLAVSLLTVGLGLCLVTLSRAAARRLRRRAGRLVRGVTEGRRGASGGSEHRLADLDRRRAVIGTFLRRMRELVDRANAVATPRERARLVSAMVESHQQLITQLGHTDVFDSRRSR